MAKIATELGAALGVLLHLPRHPERAVGRAGRGRAADDGRGGREGQRGTVAGTGVAARPGGGRVPGLRSRPPGCSPCPTRSPPSSATAPAARSSTRRPPMFSSMGEGFAGVQRGLQQRAGLRLASAHRRPLARHGRLHQGRPARRPDRGRDRRDGRRGGGPDRGRLGRGRRLRVRHADHGHRRAVPGGAGPRHRLPRRLDRPLPRRGPPGAVA